MSTSPHDQSLLLWNAQPPRIAPTAKPRERLWSLTKDSGLWSASLLGHGEYGWELQLLRDGEFRYGRRHDTRESALIEANEQRREFMANGWAICGESHGL